MKSALDILQKYWGYSEFRDSQIPIIESILSQKDTIGLLTTGGGKSICFQVPAMMSEGTCIVVSPLVALMKDQVSALNARKIPSAAYYSNQSQENQDKIIDYALNGQLKFIYISPERLVSKSFIAKLRQIKINYLVIDEAHCISQWGYDFRPQYLQIAKVYTYLGDVPKIALTATATARVIDDIQEQLELSKPNILKNSFLKSNLSYQVYPSESKLQDLVKWIQKMNGSGLVYVNRRRNAEELVKVLRTQYKIKVDYYHAGLSSELRNEKQEKWINTPNSIMISTNAFGMGIDNPHVNFVIHYNFPETIEAYFQEAGRAGRAGQNSYAISLVSTADLNEKRAIIKEYPTELEVKKTLMLLFNYYEIPHEMGIGNQYEFQMDSFIDKYKLNYNQTSKCIQILKENELIKIDEAYYKPDELQIIANESELFELSQSDPDYHILIQNIIRTFDGIFFRKKVSLLKLAKNYHYDMSDLKSKLRHLRSMEIIDYNESTNKPILEFLVKKTPIDYINFDTKQYRERKEIIVSQTQASIDFIEKQTQCRSTILLNYFDEKNASDCGICDNCLSSQSSSKWSNQDYMDIKNLIIDTLTKEDFKPISSLSNIIIQYDDKSIRKVLDRLIELNQIKKGVGEEFKLK